MSTATIRVIVTRPLIFGGKRREANEVLKVDALAAAELIGSSRAVLADSNDMQAVRDAVEADTRRVISQVGRPWHGPQPTGGWQRIG